MKASQKGRCVQWYLQVAEPGRLNCKSECPAAHLCHVLTQPSPSWVPCCLTLGKFQLNDYNVKNNISRVGKTLVSKLGILCFFSSIPFMREVLNWIQVPFLLSQFFHSQDNFPAWASISTKRRKKYLMFNIVHSHSPGGLSLRSLTCCILYIYIYI